MRWELLTSLLAVSGVSAYRPASHKGRSVRQPLAHRGVPHDRWTRDGPVAKQFESANTTQFVVNGTGIPDVDFDIGEAYAGRMSIHEGDLDSDDKLYFWFQPSPNPDAKKEIVIWLNGGPGCSSLEGFLQENGPFLWQYGTYKPVPNPWGWHHLSNILWVEQPIDTGFSSGKVTANSEEDVAKQFMGFYKNFLDTFSMHGYKVYITGESYAGAYCPYLAYEMIEAKDKDYFDVHGMMIYDPVLGGGNIADDIVAVPFVDYHYNMFPFNDSYVKQIHDTDEKCGYKALRDKHLQYPPPGNLPPADSLPGIDPKTGEEIPGCEVGRLSNDIADAVSLINPCWDVYQVATTCPLLWDVLGYPGSFGYLPKGAEVYFNRDDVKKAINAPLDREWSECGGDVFVNGDSSAPSIEKALPGVIEHTNNVIVGHGALDYVLIANGTMLAIQNMTWNGKLGFQKPPVEPFYVPYHHDKAKGTLAAAGVMGTTHSERGLTFVQVSLSGHMIPQYAPSASFRHLEKLLGRVDSLSSKKPFTTDPNYPQSDAPLGHGTAPAVYNSLKPCKKPRNI